MGTAVAYVTLAGQILPVLLSAGQSIIPLVTSILNVSDSGPTKADWDYLHNLENSLRDRLNQDPK